jgi:hypothetical protein
MNVGDEIEELLSSADDGVLDIEQSFCDAGLSARRVERTRRAESARCAGHASAAGERATI